MSPLSPRRCAVIATLAFAVALGAPLYAAAPPVSRSIWVWESETFRLLEDPAYKSEVMEFLRTHHVNRVFLYADEYKGRNLIRERPELYRALVRELRYCEIDVHALLGSYFLKTQTYILPEKKSDARAMLRRVLNYNDTSKPDERFTGVHFDIEPHMLDEWSSERPRLSILYLERIDEWMKLAGDSGLDVSAAIPFWLDGYEVQWRGKLRPMSEQVQSVLDTVVLMDYRDKAEGRDGIIRHATNEVEWAAANGRRVIIGVETGDSEPSKITFLQEGKAALEGELAKTERAFSANPGFAGFAIHHLETWMKLKE
ncbi:MAG: hypothetical protein WC538_18070 [Thermoanaerobaculia bacterium]